MTLFDRSWYNRSVVEKVFDFAQTNNVTNFLIK